MLAGEAGLASNGVQSYLSSTFFAEIKPQIEKLAHDELLKTMAYLKHLPRAENPTDQRELAERHADIEAGRGVSLTEAMQRLDRG